jgi:glutamate 5-kinase
LNDGFGLTPCGTCRPAPAAQANPDIITSELIIKTLCKNISREVRKLTVNRVVIKVGSSTLTYENGRPNLKRMEHICRVVSDLKNRGIEVVLVSSGAVAVGVNRLGLKERPTDLKGKQAAAAIGQSDLVAIYDRFFSEYGYLAAQILLTRAAIGTPNRKENIINTFSALLEYGAVPVVNENDTVSVEELVFGDNDRLSAEVAGLIGADLLIIMTDIDGLYDRDPKENPDARRILRVSEITDELLESAGGAGTSRGTGGMRSKLEAIRFANDSGINAAIISGEKPEYIYDLLDDKDVGTFFLTKENR